MRDFVPGALGGNGSLRLCDLDAIAWRRFAEPERRGLWSLVLRTVQGRLRSLPEEVLRHPLPSPSLALKGLTLDQRTLACLGRLLPLLPADNDWSVARYLQVKGFGASCLLDLLSALEGPPLALARSKAAPPLLRASPGPPFAPAIRRSLLAIRERLPLTEREAEALIAELEGGSTPPSLAHLMKQATTQGFDLPFRSVRQQGRTLLVAPAHVSVVAAACSTAAQFIRHWGLASIRQIVDQVKALRGQSLDGRLASAVLSSLPRFSWLDRRRGWFWFRDCPNRLVRAVGKVFSVTVRVQLVELSRTVFRGYGFRQRPSRRVIESVCAQLPGCRVDGDWVMVETPLDRQDWLSPTELSLLQILEERGGVVSLRRFRQAAVGKGIPRATFNHAVRESPIMWPALAGTNDPLLVMVGAPI